MPTKLSEAANLDSIQLQEQASAPATPASGFMQTYADNAGDMWCKNDGGTAKKLSGLNVSVANVSNPPTDAELDSAFGTPATVGAGYAAIVNDNNGDANNYIVVSNGTSWWYATLTKAT